MTKFNSKTEVRTKRVPVTNTKNIAGGKAYVASDRLALVNLLLTSFVSNAFYESKEGALTRLEELTTRMINSGDGEFVAKAAIYARNEFGMRSITHALAAIVASKAQADWKRRFFSKFPHRVDDMTETVARYFSVYGDKLPNGLKYGFRNAFNKFDNYQLAKYRAEGKSVSLVDLVNLVRPVPTDRNREALSQLVAGTLRNTDTWESKVSAAGNAGTEDEVEVAKGEAFAELIRTKRIGYFALLRNLRNICETAPDVINDALEFLIDEKQIRKSLVFPFRFLSAADEIEEAEIAPRLKTKIQDSLNFALEVSAANVPEFEGRTLVLLDESGSMGGGYTFRKSKMTPARIGSLFAALILSRNGERGELMKFSDHAEYQELDLSNGILNAANSIDFDGGGTYMDRGFKAMNKHYDRIIILSDFEAWGHGQPMPAYVRNYENKYGKTKIYSFNLASQDNTVLFPEDSVVNLAGFSDKALTFMSYNEREKAPIISAIEAVAI